ncbi:MAG TPA: hypothetical protein EYP78_02050 [Candidatus Omnitrophica bacterium]|nr:hypothetical protein [Candidatus Omnitrophota bacterium]
MSVSIFSIFFAMSFANWAMGTEAIPQSTALFFLLLFLFIALSKELKKLTEVMLLGVVFATALLSEIMVIYFLPAFIFLLYTEKKCRKEILLFIFFTAIFFFPVYWLFFYYIFKMPELKEMLNSFFWMAPRIEISYPLLTGFIFTSLAFVFSPGVDLLSFPALYAGSLWHNILNYFLLNIAVLSLIWILFRLPKLRESSKNLILFSLLWSFIPLPIIIYREAWALDNIYYTLPGIWLLFFLIWNDMEVTFQYRRVFLSSSVVILAIFVLNNFICGIYPLSRLEKNEMYEEYRYLTSLVDEGEPILLISDGGNFETYELYFLLQNHSKREWDLLILDFFPYRSYLTEDLSLYSKRVRELSKSETAWIFMIYPSEKPEKIEEVISLLKNYHHNESYWSNSLNSLVNEFLASYDEFKILPSTRERQYLLIKMERNSLSTI